MATRKSVVKKNEINSDVKEVVKKFDETVDSIKVKDIISLTDQMLMVEEAVDLCFSEDKYNPVMEDFALKYVFIKYATDYDIDSQTKEEGIEKINIALSMFTPLNGIYLKIKECNYYLPIKIAFEKAIKDKLQEKYHASKIIDFIKIIGELLSDGEFVESVIPTISNIVPNKEADK